MHNKRIISVFALVLSAAMLFSACSNAAETTVVTTTEAATVQAETTTAPTVEAKDVSIYDVTDGDYKISISPIYKKDGKTVVAAYILSVKDKDNKVVTAQTFPLLNSVVAASSTKQAIALTKDKNKNYIKINSYADEKGNLLVIQDSGDANKNGNTAEFLKLTKITNEQGSTHYLLSDTAVKIVTEKDGVYAIIDGKKIKVDTVDAKNTKVVAKLQEQSKAKKQTTTKKGSTTKKTSKSKGSKSKDGGKKDETTQESKLDTYGKIVLLKNGEASSSVSGVETSSHEVLINKGGEYLVTSDTSTWHGVIKIQLKNTEEADVRFENVDISYNKGNIIQIIDSTESVERDFIEAEASAESIDDDVLNDEMDDLSDVKSAPNVSLTFPTGTSSSFECSSNIKTGVIYNESKLEIKGNGKVNVTATSNANNVICSSKSVTFKNVTAHLKSAAFGVTENIGGSKGIFCYNKVNMDSGDLTIQSNGDAIRCTRFYQEGGTFNATSSAADGIDAESSISIKGGKSTVTALNKSSFKVRRANIQERYDNGERVNPKDCIRSGKDDGFYISGGTVKGESKKVSDYKMHASQNTIVCRTVKSEKGKADETKKPVSWNVSSVASSSNPCVKFLYSSSSVSNKEYAVKVNNTEKEYKWQWSGKYGSCKVVYTTSKASD